MENFNQIETNILNKIKNISNFIPNQEVSFGPARGKLAVVGWGSSFGAINQSLRSISNKNVSQIHINYISPFPKKASKKFWYRK